MSPDAPQTTDACCCAPREAPGRPGSSDLSSHLSTPPLPPCSLADPAVDFPLLFDEPEHGVQQVGPRPPEGEPPRAISDLHFCGRMNLSLPGPHSAATAPLLNPPPPCSHAQQVPAAAPLPLGPTGLRLKLDCGAVMSAWQAQAQVHPFQLRGSALQAAVAALPSTADLEASLAAASQQCSMGPAQPPSAAALAAAEARRKLEAQRQRDRKAAARKSDRKVCLVCSGLCCSLCLAAASYCVHAAAQQRGVCGRSGWRPARTAARYGQPGPPAGTG